MVHSDLGGEQAVRYLSNGNSTGDVSLLANVVLVVTVVGRRIRQRTKKKVKAETGGTGKRGECVQRNWQFVSTNKRVCNRGKDILQ